MNIKSGTAALLSLAFSLMNGYDLAKLRAIMGEDDDEGDEEESFDRGGDFYEWTKNHYTEEGLEELAKLKSTKYW